MKIWLDGEIVDEADARISVFDHGLLYGDGIFEGARFYKRRIFRLREHVERLQKSAKAILLDLPWSTEEITEAVCETVRQNPDLEDGYIRLVVTRGRGSLGLNPYLCPKPSMFIIASTITLYPEENYRKGIPVITCATRRVAPAALMPQVKSLNYLNNIMAKMEAIQADAMEGLMLNEQGYVAECTGDNVFYISGDELVTPPPSDGALVGITRQAILELAPQVGLKVAERSMTRYDLYVADEMFLTGSAAEVIPVSSLDKRIIGNGGMGPWTEKLKNAFQKLTETDGELVK